MTDWVKAVQSNLWILAGSAALLGVIETVSSASISFAQGNAPESIPAVPSSPPPLGVENQQSLASVRSQLSDLNRFPLFLSSDQGTITAAASQLSPTQLSQPSFSWIRDQIGDRLGSDTLIEQWQAYKTSEGFQYVDVIVRESQWNRLSYFCRYGFVLQFGTVAQDNQYQLRVFHSGDATNRNDALALQDIGNRSEINNRGMLLRGAYFCSVSASSTTAPSANTATTSTATTDLPDCSAFVRL